MDNSFSFNRRNGLVGLIESMDPVFLAGTGSQQSNVEEVDRTVANSRVDTSLYTDIQRRIVNYANVTKVLVPLFEFNTHPAFAQQALSVFQWYWRNPEDIDDALEKLEKARREMFSQ